MRWQKWVAARPSLLSGAILQSKRAICDLSPPRLRQRPQTPDNAAGNDATPHYSALHSTLYPSFCMFRMYTLRRVAENREEHRSRVTIDSTAREPACPASPRSACRSCLRQPAIGRSGRYPPRARLWRSAIINACFPFDMKGPPETPTCKERRLCPPAPSLASGSRLPRTASSSPASVRTPQPTRPPHR